MDTDGPRSARLAERLPRAPVAGIEPVPLTLSLDDLDLPEHALTALSKLIAAERDRAAWAGQHAGIDAGATRALLVGGAREDRLRAAAAVAHALDKPLWRADLARFVRRYIGETEKMLGRVFGAATRGDAVLLFDEADALFGRRTAVRDAHDRYANLVVNHLHARLDAHPGLVLLATDKRPTLDGAFARRLACVIDFPWRAPPAGA